MYVSISVVLAYAAVHSVLLFVHVATMNVAMNSDDQALLSLLIGGNFAEIKSTVFKKYNKASLFKITATDICERFKLALFLVLVLTLNLSQGMDKKMVRDPMSIYARRTSPRIETYLLLCTKDIQVHAHVRNCLVC